MPFNTPQDAIGALDPVSAATLAAGAADLAFVLDGEGLIRDVAVQAYDLAGEIEGYTGWLGRSWDEIFPAEVRPKAAKILAEANRERMSPWRQLTHKAVTGGDVSILYAALRAGADDRLVVLGRDMRAVSALQQRLIDAQIAMERDYARLRSAETRYRLLFHASNEPVVVLNAGSAKIVELNAAAEALVGSGTRRLIGRSFGDLVAADGRAALLQSFAQQRDGRGSETEVTLIGAGRIRVMAMPLRQDAAGLLLLRLHRLGAPAARDGTAAEQAGGVSGRAAEGSSLAAFAAVSPDAVVIVDGDGHVLAANASFVEMAEVTDAPALYGEPLSHWFGRTGIDFDLAMMNLRQTGSLRLFATELRGMAGSRVAVEASAVAVGGGYGFAIRDIGRRADAPTRTLPELPHSAEQLTELIGRVPLKDLVRETTDVIEKLCIEAALDLTKDNRASAAEVLGLSRQSLYVKLRRFGLADAVGEADV